MLSIPVIYISWRSLKSARNHGFYRFVSWECIVWLFVDNAPVWFNQPGSWYQLISWILLILCVYPVTAGIVEFKKFKREKELRQDSSLFSFERTTQLITTGIFRVIRHPMYASLVWLTWGIFFKKPGWINLIVSIISTLFLILTMRMEEIENLRYFGEPYRQFMKRTKRFIPFIF